MNRNMGTALQTQTDRRLAQQRTAEGICLDSRNSACGRRHETIVSMLAGAILGWAIGVAQLIFIGSWQLFYWEFTPLIPLCSAFGWSLLAMIIGGSGLFSKARTEVPGEELETVHMDTAA